MIDNKEMRKYPKIYRIGHDEVKQLFKDDEDEIIIEEKIDGGNFRFYITEKGEIVFGSRNRVFNNDKAEKGFTRCIMYIKEKISEMNLYRFRNHIFFGENCIRHTMNYDWDKMPPFLGFDVFDIKNNIFVPNFIKIDMFEELGLETVPLINSEKAFRFTKNPDWESFVPVSKYCLESAEDKKAEGVVFKNYNKQIFAKYVRDEFKERNSKVFGGNPKYNKVDDTNNEDYVFKYCTNNRIEKEIFKMIDEGFKLEMQMMKELPRRVNKDIITEEYQEIMNSNWKIDFKKIRRLIPKRCRAVLEQVITNNQI